jgi:hypothetical protein
MQIQRLTQKKKRKQRIASALSMSASIAEAEDACGETMS